MQAHCSFSFRCPMRESKDKPRKPYRSMIPKECLYVRDENIELKYINFLYSDDEDEIGFYSIKEESPVKE